MSIDLVLTQEFMDLAEHFAIGYLAGYKLGEGVEEFNIPPTMADDVQIARALGFTRGTRAGLAELKKPPQGELFV